MKRRKKPSLFKKWEDKFKKIKLKKDKLVLLALIVGGILGMSFSGLYFKSILEKETLELRRELEKGLLEYWPNNTISPEIPQSTSMETLFRLEETGIERHFLSEVELIGGLYTPTIHTCLFEEGKPIYPLYVYETQSLLRHPAEPPPKIFLMRYLLLPEDNLDFQPDEKCFIREIKTESDWQELEEKYGFSKQQF